MCFVADSQSPFNKRVLTCFRTISPSLIGIETISPISVISLGSPRSLQVLRNSLINLAPVFLSLGSYPNIFDKKLILPIFQKPLSPQHLYKDKRVSQIAKNSDKNNIPLSRQRQTIFSLCALTFYLRNNNSRFTSGDKVIDLDGRCRPNAQARSEYGRESG